MTLRAIEMDVLLAECCSNNGGVLLHANFNRTLENLCCSGCRFSRLNGEVVYTLITS